MADREEDAVWRPGVEPLATKRGEDATAVLAALADTDVDYLAAARRRFIAIEGPHSARRTNWTTCGGSCRVRGISMRTAGFGRRPRFASLRTRALESSWSASLGRTSKCGATDPLGACQRRVNERSRTG